MKVLLAAGIFPPETGGPATYAKQIADELPKRGVDVQVVLFRDVRSLPPIIRHLAYTFRLLWRGRKADIIFAQDPVSVGVPARIAAALLRKKFVLRVGGDYAWEQSVQRFGITESLDEFVHNRRAHSWRVRFLCALQAWVAKGAHTVITPSEYLKRIVLTWGVPGTALTAIYSAITIPELPQKDALRQKFSWQNEPVIVSAGRLVPWKGFPALIEAFNIIRKDIPSAKLFIAGEGPQKRELVAAATAGGNIKLLGPLTQIRLLELVKAADLFVLNTGYEGLSHQLIEVMQAGTPVITTPVGGNVELIENGKDGILVEHNNVAELSSAMRSVLSGEFETTAMIAAAKTKADSFTTERMVEQTVAALGA